MTTVSAPPGAPTSASGPGARVARPPLGMMIAVLSSAGLIGAVMLTILVPLIPEVPTLLGVRAAEDASWLITAALLAGAVATPSLSRLADMFGKRRMMVIALVLPTVGSVIGAVGTSLGITLPAPGRYVVAAADADETTPADVLVGSDPMRVDLRMTTRSRP